MSCRRFELRKRWLQLDLHPSINQFPPALSVPTQLYQCCAVHELRGRLHVCDVVYHFLFHCTTTANTMAMLHCVSASARSWKNTKRFVNVSLLWMSSFLNVNAMFWLIFALNVCSCETFYKIHIIRKHYCTIAPVNTQKIVWIDFSETEAPAIYNLWIILYRMVQYSAFFFLNVYINKVTD